MKKLFLTFALFTSLASFSQYLNVPVSSAVAVNGVNHDSEGNAAIVPTGKIWQLAGSQSNSSGILSLSGWFVKIGSDLFNGNSLYGNPVFPEGTKFFINGASSITFLSFIEYDLDAQSLAYTNPTVEDRIELFPNPTNSKVALNSEKSYDIEVYNLQGQKLMETTGNVIDLSNLSTAVYIVKVFDTIEKKYTSYKVVKK